MIRPDPETAVRRRLAVVYVPVAVLLAVLAHLALPAVNGASAGAGLLLAAVLVAAAWDVQRTEQLRAGQGVSEGA